MSELWSWDRWRQALDTVFDALDWRALGTVYFHEQGEERWQALRGKVVDCGQQWARALLRRVQPTGRSLHVAAGVAELPVLLAERFVRGRSVAAVNRSERECDLLNKGLKKAGIAGQLRIEPIDGATAATERRGYDHLGCVSLFTDPMTWPIVSGVAYGRIAPVQLDVEAFVRERESARALCTTLFAGLQRPGLVTTSAEEVAWFLEAAAAAGAQWDVDDDLLPTAVVGDPIGFVRFK